MATMKNDFHKLLEQIEREAQAEGPQAVRELRRLQALYRKIGDNLRRPPLPTPWRKR
jgi:hypothetical protein